MYNKILRINKDFKASINLQYDLNDENKILQYIPTTDLCDAIKILLNNILGKRLHHSTLVSGPYGKGKSFLMLVVVYILSIKKDKHIFESFLSKINIIDPELYELILEIEEKNIHLLPVVISNNSNNIVQDFLVSLNTTLEQYRIKGVIPNTSFNAAIELIEKWENESVDDSFDIISFCQKILKISIQDIKNGLQECDKDSFNQFEQLYSCVSRGGKFNPLVSDDIGLIYEEVAKHINDFGYKGILILFDEFGAFLENQTGDFGSRLLTIQKIAEKCDTIQEALMHLCCITHKSFTLYSRNQDILDEFTKIAGRFDLLRFDRSSDENYQLICSIIEKEDSYEKVCTSNYNEEWLDKINELSLFSSDKQVEYLYNNGFPFNPMTLFCLLQISEKIGQNERTIFTFLADTDVNGFKFFISNNNTGLLNVPMIYDYFENTIKDNPEYKTIYYSVEGLKRLSQRQQEHDIIKTIAIIKLINDNVRLSSNIKTIALSLCRAEHEVKNDVEELIRKSILKRNENDYSIDFATISDADTLQMIDKVIVEKYAAIDLSELLFKYQNKSFYVSNRYNFKYCMTRYFSVQYLEYDKFLDLNSFEGLFKEFSDGLIIDLVDFSETTKETEIIRKLENLKDYRIIVREPTKNLEAIKEKIRRVLASEHILKNQKNISDIAIASMTIMINDYREEIDEFIESAYEKSNTFCLADISSKQFHLNMYCSLEQSYGETIVVINEQINKNEISGTTAKARNTVIDNLLNGDRPEYRVTSAEGTIRESIDNAIRANDKFIKTIEGWFIASCGNKLSVETLVKKLKDKPYGMRLGVIPLFLASVIFNLTTGNEETILLYNGSQQIELNANNLSKAMEAPEKYYFYYDKIGKEKIDMIKYLINYFKLNSEPMFIENVANVVSAIKKHCRNLPPLVLKADKNENLLSLSKEEIAFKTMFLRHDINSYETLFKDSVEIFNCSTYRVLGKKITKIIDEINNKIDKFYENLVSETIECFGVQTNSLKSCFDIWKSKFPRCEDIIFEADENKLFVSFNNLLYDNIDAINVLAYDSVNSVVVDFTIKKKEQFLKKIKNMISFVENYDYDVHISKKEIVTSQNIELHGMETNLYSTLVEELESFGESISNERKILILQKMMNDLMK